VLKASKFLHDTSRPRTIRWREWAHQANFAFGATLPMLVNQLSEVCNPKDYWWGISWHNLLDFENMDKTDEQKVFLSFSKTQHSILHFLSENLDTHEKQIISTNILMPLWKYISSSNQNSGTKILSFFSFKHSSQDGLRGSG
jgi:hypothetical protein